MIKLVDISLRRGPYLLFEDVSLDIHDGEKIGLVGDNGSGKSSLIAMMLGEIGADTGDYNLPADTRIAHVAQETPSNDRSALDYVLDGDREWRRLRNAIDRLEAEGAVHATHRVGPHAHCDGVAGGVEDTRRGDAQDGGRAET